MTALTPQLAAVAAVMDEIDNCRNPLPCDLCRDRMQSILDMGAAAERERLMGTLGCPSVVSPDTELAAELFKTMLVIAGPRRPVLGGVWLRESAGSGSAVCDVCGRLDADSLEYEHLAGLARDHTAETDHQVIVHATSTALYGPKDDTDDH